MKALESTEKLQNKDFFTIDMPDDLYAKIYKNETVPQ